MFVFHLPSSRHFRHRPHLFLGILGFTAICIWLQTRIWIASLGIWNCYAPKSPPSLHVVLSAIAETSTDWTARINVPNTRIIPYVVNDPRAPFHTGMNKGNEAMVYLTYIHEFYDSLPEITIFVHGEDEAWHMDGILEQSTVYAINNLDYEEVLKRQYANLKISWANGCPDWMNTTITSESEQYEPDLKGEEPMMKASFEQLFPNTTAPEILSQPCCSQFAVTKEAIRSVPREQYGDFIKWLELTYLSDNLSGRIWEHLWQYVFLKKGVDCPIEYKTLCRMYHICFETEEDWDAWKYLELTRLQFRGEINQLLENGKARESQLVRNVQDKIDRISAKIVPWKDEAVELGRSAKARRRIIGEV